MITGEETAALVHIACGDADRVSAELYLELHSKGLVNDLTLTEAGKDHLRAIAAAMSRKK
jgi:uncharacterized protein with GYD domain